MGAWLQLEQVEKVGGFDGVKGRDAKGGDVGPRITCRGTMTALNDDAAKCILRRAEK